MTVHTNTPAQPGPLTLEAAALASTMNKARTQTALNAIASGEPFTQVAAAQAMVATMNKVKSDFAAQKDSELVAAIVERALGISSHDNN